MSCILEVNEVDARPVVRRAGYKGRRAKQSGCFQNRLVFRWIASEGSLTYAESR